MSSIRILACVVLVPALVAAENFVLGGCCEFRLDNWVDDMAHTQEGMNTMDAFFDSTERPVYLWNPLNPENKFTELKLRLSLASGFTLKFTNGTTVKTVTGSMAYVQAPRTFIVLTSVGDAATTKAMDGVFSFNEHGVADLYPVYISSTDVILRGCRDVFFGRSESVYVLTSQDYSGLDSTCAKAAVKELTGWVVQ